MLAHLADKALPRLSKPGQGRSNLEVSRQPRPYAGSEAAWIQLPMQARLGTLPSASRCSATMTGRSLPMKPVIKAFSAAALLMAAPAWAQQHNASEQDRNFVSKAATGGQEE